MKPHLKGRNTHLRGTLETVKGVALVEARDTDGNPLYSGKSEIWWDELKTVYRNGERLWVDYDGSEFHESLIEWRECDEACH
jgi:hypothetical protein